VSKVDEQLPHNKKTGKMFKALLTPISLVFTSTESYQEEGIHHDTMVAIREVYEEQKIIQEIHMIRSHIELIQLLKSRLPSYMGRKFLKR